MELQVRPVTSRMEGYSEIARIYNGAFPRRERLPIRVLLLMARRENVDFWAFYDGDIFCGLAYLIRYGSTTLVFYLVTNDELRSRGYGSEILGWITANTTKTIVLDAEAVESGRPVSNLEQRVRRQKFYQKNGFGDSGYSMREYGELYDILYYGAEFSAEELKRLLKWFSFGLAGVIFKIERKPDKK